MVGACWGHGLLVDPPSRASAWRFGYDTPIDYNDNEGFCGGFNVSIVDTISEVINVVIDVMVINTIMVIKITVVSTVIMAT